MKRWKLCLLTLTMAATLTACGQKEPAAQPPAPQEPTQEITKQPTEPATELTTREPEPEMLACTPEELKGTWLMVSGETEGYAWDAMPGRFESMVFRMEESRLVADSEQGDLSGYVPSAWYSKEVTVLDEPLYEGCGNEEWSARLGEKSPVDAQGYPTGTDYHVTLLDHDTLLCQQYFSLDGGPGVSYQTFKRFPAQEGMVAYSDLSNTFWTCASYVAADGTEYPAVPGREGLLLELGDNMTFHMTWLDEESQLFMLPAGGWILGEGNTLLLHSYEDQGWYAGTVGSAGDIPAEGDRALYLWVDGGVMTLIPAEGDGYADTMNDLEGNALAAPADALLVLYSDQYPNMERHEVSGSIPGCNGEDGAYCRSVIASAVVDNTRIWLEKDGVVLVEAGTLYAGESVIIRTQIYDAQGAFLHFEVNGIDYQYELISENLNLYDGWSYIIPA